MTSKKEELSAASNPVLDLLRKYGNEENQESQESVKKQESVKSEKIHKSEVRDKSIESEARDKSNEKDKRIKRDKSIEREEREEREGSIKSVKRVQWFIPEAQIAYIQTVAFLEKTSPSEYVARLIQRDMQARSKEREQLKELIRVIRGSK